MTVETGGRKVKGRKGGERGQSRGLDQSVRLFWLLVLREEKSCSEVRKECDVKESER